MLGLGPPGGWRSGRSRQMGGVPDVSRYIEISKFVSEVAPVLHCQLVTTWHLGLLGSQVPRGSAFMTVTYCDYAFSNPSDLTLA